MKKFSKRSLAWLASLMLFISIFAGVIVLPAEAATVNYVKDGKYVYNWGQRDVLATFLSPMAEDWYDDNNVTYAQLASLSGSSSTSSVPDSSLYDALHTLMYENLDNPTSYDDTRDLFKYTDCENSGGSISSFYSGTAIGPSWDSGKTWNREHCWPNSKSNGGSNSNTQRETDIMMLRPASVSENSSRSNTAYGESSKFYDPNALGQNVRGDAARIVLYVYVCWGGSSAHDGALNYMWGSSGVIESKEILLKWMEEDPVDTWELGRNDSVEAITGTRNVFVDYPELAFLLFDEEVPAGYDSPSGEGTTAGYTVKASTNNSNYGTVSVKGNVITAAPKTGYMATGYTILSGAATVKRNGNVFTVSPTSDVSVRINFGKREERTVQFVQAGGVISTMTSYAGDPITLPAHSGSVPAGQTFVGWCEQEISETTDEPTYYAAGASWTVSAGVTLYALYARTEEGGVVNNNTFDLYSGELTEGDYLIIYNDGAMKAEVSADRFTYAEVSTASGSIKDPAADIVWHIAKDGNYWTLYNVAAEAYAGGNGTKNKGALLSSVTDFAKWTATGSSAYEFVNLGNKNKSVNSNLRRNGTYGFACYSTSTGGALTLYKRQSGTVYYSTAAKVVCTTHTYDNACDVDCNVCGETRTPSAHAYVSKVTTAATCIKTGVRTYTCSACGDNYTEAIPALGHTYDNDCDADCNACGATRTPSAHVYVGKVTTAATCGKDGVKTYTCSVCGDSYTDAISATGEHTYDNACDADCNVCGATRTPSSHVYVGEVTTAATCGKDGVKTYTCSVCGDSYTDAIFATGEHTYDNACDAECNTCGGIREVGEHVYDNANDATCNQCGAVRQIAKKQLFYAGSSVSEDVDGLAFLFNAYVSGVQVKNGNEYVTGSASVMPYVDGDSYKVVRMGAVVSNGKSEIDIEATYLWGWRADAASFAVRIVNIPEGSKDTVVTARPYYVYEVDGEEIVVYGTPVSKTYNEVAQ